MGQCATGNKSSGSKNYHFAAEPAGTEALKNKRLPKLFFHATLANVKLKQYPFVVPALLSPRPRLTSECGKANASRCRPRSVGTRDPSSYYYFHSVAHQRELRLPDDRVRTTQTVSGGVCPTRGRGASGQFPHQPLPDRHRTLPPGLCPLLPGPTHRPHQLRPAHFSNNRPEDRESRSRVAAEQEAPGRGVLLLDQDYC